ncbi:CHAT domain-containing protein [Nannocystis sp. ILAH1]|uniref:CHAT domain-containing protein n=1 Tax=Nannocystis sp. ILAH1 TaxID=2996789 RepID=UPI0022706B3E|nr:CHAT domain-containing protein [Nannocystis sp. ILAH1]MCY0992148.1 CHAT domain-containing protein [Nannocystis sp. ILAH1]
MAHTRLEVSRQVRRRFGRGSPIVVAVELCGELEEQGHPLLEVLPAAAEAMVRHAKGVREEQLFSAIQRLYDPGAPLTGSGCLATLYCWLHAVGRLASGRALEMCGLMAMMQVRKLRHELRLEGPLEILLAEAGVVATARLADNPVARIARADAQSFLASAECGSPIGGVHEHGLERMQTTVDMLAGYLAAPEMLADASGADLARAVRSMHAQALSNLGQAWATRTIGDKQTNLRRAVELFESARAIPERREDPPSYQHVLQQSVSAMRELAIFTTDAGEARDLLTRGLVLADEALALPRRFPGKVFHWDEPTHVAAYNIRMRDLEDRRSRRLGDDAALRGKLVALADEALAFLATAKRRGEPLFVNAADVFRRLREGGGDIGRPGPDTGFVRALAERLRAEERRFVTQQEAEILLRALIGWFDTPWPTELWPRLAYVLSAVHPQHVGCTTARRLFVAELALLQRCDDVAMILGSIQRLQQGLTDLVLADEQRRCYAGALSERARLRLAHRERHPCSPAELLALCDLLGSTTYRADTGFYGQGPAHEHGPGAEAVWRMSMYRARWDVDRAALLLGVQTWVDEDPSVGDELAPLLEHLHEVRTIDLQGKVGPCHMIESPEEVLSAAEDELLGELQHGGARGWRPAHGGELPVADPDELTEWLGRHRTTAVLLDVTPLDYAIVTSDGRSLQMHAPYAGLAIEERERFVAAVKAFTHLRLDAAHTNPDAVFDASLTALVAAGGPVVAALRRCCAELGVDALVLLSRGVMDMIPWAALFAATGNAEGPAIVHVPTLAPAGTLHAAVRSGAWTVIGEHEGKDPDLDRGWSALRAAGVVPEVGPDFATFDRKAAEVGVLRLFVHGEHAWVPPLMGMSMHPSLTRRRVFYQAKDVVMLDLTGCGRVECWACDTGHTADLLGPRRHEDEGRSLATAFLLAGARAVIGASWRQPSAAAALISAGFATAASRPGDPVADARALARVLRRYREVVADPALTSPDGWRVALAAMIGVDPQTLPVTPAPPLRVGDLRANYAWAGWRVCMRDRTCLDP